MTVRGSFCSKRDMTMKTLLACLVLVLAATVMPLVGAAPRA